LFGATPAEAVSAVSSRICSRIAFATAVAESNGAFGAVTSRYASSSDSGSTRSVWRSRISRTCFDTAR